MYRLGLLWLSPDGQAIRLREALG